MQKQKLRNVRDNEGGAALPVPLQCPDLQPNSPLQSSSPCQPSACCTQPLSESTDQYACHLHGIKRLWSPPLKLCCLRCSAREGTRIGFGDPLCICCPENQHGDCHTEITETPTSYRSRQMIQGNITGMPSSLQCLFFLILYCVQIQAIGFTGLVHQEILARW